MYVPPAFRIDRAASLAFAAARGFGTVVAYDGRRPMASPLPFHLSYRVDGTPIASFHVARGNPLAALVSPGENWLIAVSGADAYVSPDWYVSPEQVPTWLYEAVHLGGPARLVSADATRAHLGLLTAQFEPVSDNAWTPARLTAGRREAMLNAIVGIEMDIETVEGASKLNQAKSDADHQAVAIHLRETGEAMAAEISARMVALRPQLSYEDAEKELSHG